MNDMLYDVLLMAIFPMAIVIVTIVSIVHNRREQREGCEHEWGKWEFSSTLYAFVQTRACSKCGFNEIHQTKRFTKQP